MRRFGFYFSGVVVFLVVLVALGMRGRIEAFGGRDVVLGSLVAQVVAGQIYGGDYYFGWRGEVVRLDESLETVGLSFEGDLTGSGVAAIVSSLEMYSAMVELHPDAAVGAGDVLRVSVLPDAPDAARAAIESAVGRVEIAQVHRVYRMGSRNESMLTNYISMVVRSGAEEETLLMLLDDGCEVLYRSDYGGLGTVGFRVRVPFSVQVSSGESVLERANRYHGLGFVGHAAPVFAPLYQTQHSVPSDIDKLYYDMGRPDGDVPGSDVRWHYKKMGMEAAWDNVYGVDWVNFATATKKVVAVIDNGMFVRYGGFSVLNGYDSKLSDFTPAVGTYSYQREGVDVFPDNTDGNPELVDKGSSPGPGAQWFNWGEINEDLVSGKVVADGVDDDKNGRIDDYFGWDFVGSDPLVFDDATVVGDNIPFPDPVDNFVIENPGIRGHATGAAVVIAAIPNNDGDLSATEVEKLNNDSVNGTGTDGGMVGMCPSCEIMPIRVHTQSYAKGAVANDTADVFYAGRSELAIMYAAGWNDVDKTFSGTRADVLGIMISIESYDPMFHEAIKIARRAGCVLVGSSGNNNVSMDVNPYFPNVWPEVLAVGSSEYKVVIDDSAEHKERRQSSSREPFSGPNYGWALDVVAYSVSGEETNRSSSMAAGQEHTPYANYAGVKEAIGRYIYGNGVGTSSAMPQVAALAGLVLTRYPELNPMEVQAVLQVSADDLEYSTNGSRTWTGGSTNAFTATDSFSEIAGEGRDMYTGWGRINAASALSKAKQVVDEKDFYFTYTGMESGRHWENGMTGKWEHQILSMIRDDHTDEPGLSTTDHIVFDGWIVEKASSGELGSVALGDMLFGNPVVARLDLNAQTLYLKGDLVQGGTFSVPTDALFTIGIDDVDGYISNTGDLVTKNQVFSITTADRTPDYFHRVTTVTELTDLFTNVGGEWVAPSSLEGDVIELAEKPAGQSYELSQLINFNGVNFVIRSENPGDMDVVKNTVLKLDAAQSGRIITFSGTETNRSGIMGVTIEGDGVDNGGIEGGGATATISFCRFVKNYTSGDGGAINDIDGQITQNVFGDLAFDDNTGGNYATGNGGAVANQNKGTTYQNIFWYNEAGVDGGAISDFSIGVKSNFILYNKAGGSGGGIAHGNATEEVDGGGGFVRYIDPAIVRGNIVYGNDAVVKGGGMYDCWGQIENNTIVLNKSGSPAYGVADCERLNHVPYSRNNIVWGNEYRLAPGVVKDGVGEQVTLFSFYNYMEASAIGEAANPANAVGSNEPAIQQTNIGPWDGVDFDELAELEFKTMAFDSAGTEYPSRNWGTFLHLKFDPLDLTAPNTSPLVNAGHFTHDVAPGVAGAFFRDVDDQVGPLGPTVGDPLVYRRDIGADEIPTPDDGGNINSIQWWERF